jgi:threonine/homoserine/homoserine lactone efflux protein
MLHTLAAFVAVSVVVICTPGQDTALIIRNTLSGGRPSGTATAGGVTVGLVIWVVATSAGLAALLNASEPVFHTLQLAGAAYLVYLGAHSLWAALTRNGRRRTTTATTQLAPGRAFRQGLLSNLGNPKVAVFFASLLPQFVPQGSASFAALLGLGLLFCTMGFTWLMLYAVAVARIGRLFSRPVRRAFDAITGVVLVAFGFRLASER